MNYDAIQEKLADQYYRDYVQNPDWKEVAEQADSEDMAKVFYLLMTGQEQQAKQNLALILDAVARDCGEIEAMHEVETMRDDAMVMRGFAA